MKAQEQELPLKDRVNNALARHWKFAVLSLVAVVAVMAGILVLRSMNEERRARAAIMAEDIQESFVEWIAAASEDRDSSTLEALIDEALTDYPSTFAAQRALYTKGLMALENEAWEEASESFLLLADEWEESYLASVSLYNAASALEEQGKDDEAVSVLQQLVDEYDQISPDVPDALYQLGRLAEKRGEMEEALAAYKDIAARFPQSRWNGLGKTRILVIEGR
ncbi:MAG: tetratricopeptide repeat protein [Spirochaetales bacterium]|nr:tetratricopeptide repeat protein [Spirochaetales bacterium]